MELTRVDYTLLGLTSPHCMKLLPNNIQKMAQKVAVGDHDGVVQLFSLKRGEIQLGFKTLPGDKITRLLLGGALGTPQDKIFVSSKNEVRGYTKKGKLFLGFETNLTETIQSMAVSASDLMVCGSQIYNHYRDCKDADSYLSADHINDVIALSAEKLHRLTPVLACEDRMLRVLDHSTLVHSFPLAGVPTVLHLYNNDGSSTGDQLLYGTDDGSIGLVQITKEEHRMGGVAIYIQETAAIKAEEIKISNQSLELVFEAALVKIRIKNKNFYLLGMYRPPGGQARLAIDILSEVLESLQADTKTVVLMGDINIDRLTENASSNYLEEELSTFGVRRLPLPATRITNHSRTSIDCICTNTHDNAIDFAIINAGIADHTGQTCTLKIQSEVTAKTDMSQKIFFSRKNLDSMKDELSKENWIKVHNAPDAEEAYSAFQRTVRLILDHACPIKKIRAKQKGQKIKVQYDEEVKILKEDFLDALHQYELTGIKAFDCLGHNLILRKLTALGIEGMAKDWVASYLKRRTQIVEIRQNTNGRKSVHRSTQLSINRGVPQGSVMGPFLFILFTNDFPDFIRNDNCETIMYADDTTLLFMHDLPQELHSNILSSTDKALQYCLQNDLAINPSKTTQLNFSRKHEQIQEIPEITVEKNSKLLGLTIDEDLSWNDHIHNLTKKLASGVHVIKRMKWIGGLETAKTAYYAVIESHIRYCLISWGGTSEANLNKVLVLQKKAVRALSGLERLDSCREAFKSLKLLTVTALYIHGVVLYTKKLNLPRNENFHSYHTRKAADYNLPIHHTTQYSRKPSYIGRKIINSLPNNLKNATGNQFKQQLWDWLVDRPVAGVSAKWRIEPGKHRGGVQCLYCYDMTGDGVPDLLVGRSDGTVQIYSIPVDDADDLNQPSERFSHVSTESVTAIQGGVVGNNGFDEVLVTTYTGWFFGLTTEVIDKQMSGEGGDLNTKVKISNDDKLKIVRLRTEIEELEQKLVKERERYHIASLEDGIGISTIPFFNVTDKMTLVKDTAVYQLMIEVETAIDNILLQSDVPLDLLDVDKNSAVLSRSACAPGSDNRLLATYRCQMNTTRLELCLRTTEGVAGTLCVYITAVLQPKCCQLRRHQIKPLSLHTRCHQLDVSRSFNSLGLKGNFSLAEMHSWVSHCLPEVPEKPPLEDKVSYIFTSTLMHSMLHCTYRSASVICYMIYQISVTRPYKGEAEFRSDNVSTICILKDFITKEATKKKIKLEISIDINDDSAASLLRRLDSRLSSEVVLARQVGLLEALRELETVEGRDLLSPEYQQILDNQKQLLERYNSQPGYLTRLTDTIAEMYIHWHKIKGVNVKVKIPVLMETLQNFNLDDLLLHFK
ncbi:Bardet-Biedl syndrome 7 protein homolog [Macrosteles quadrilineatus]|uniref:Bardet-Biedl syndrome 7 protein homolog n=1 Tax=Macrosteles quadrilineatus TaxID=74068 RepID=UPI0023E26FFC|nr:Bardet-Biedl syndrome 7 protein homolog [Macrosteles quadrilineatus]